MDNEKLYEQVYNTLYANNYISNDTDSHLYEERYNVQGLLYTIDSTGIEYNSILDVGCGRGNGINHLKRQGKDVYGVEISSIAVNAAQKKGLNVVTGSITSIPYEDDRFDLVVSTDVVEHLFKEDVKKAITELARVSKKYVALKIATCEERGANKLLEKLKEKGEIDYDFSNLHLTVENKEFWLNLFEAVGLKVMLIKDDYHPKFGLIDIRCVLEKEV
jgi:2-polyprenyl-3-methyl-5-hydroxy-6-metoxy-1,4-benzoquinol methylase